MQYRDIIECNEQDTYEVILMVHDGSGWSNALAAEWVPMEAAEAVGEVVRTMLAEAAAKASA